MMKPFLPQLQTTFIKSLAEPSAVVRSRATRALERLVKMSARVDPLINELISGIKTAEPNIKISFIEALEIVLGRGGKVATAPVMLTTVKLLTDLMADDDDDVRAAAAGALGAHSGNVEDDGLLSVMQGLLEHSPEWTTRHGQTLALAALLKHAATAERWSAASSVAQAAAQLAPLVKDDRVPVRIATAKAIEGTLRILLAAAVSSGHQSGEVESGLWKNLITLLSDSSPDVRISAVSSIKSVSKTAANGRLQAQTVEALVVPLFNCLRDKVTVRDAQASHHPMPCLL